MAYKYFTVLVLSVACKAALLPSAAVQLPQAAVYSPAHGNLERYAPAIYDFAYSVHDSSTGDIKSHHESRRDDVVEGQYSLVEPDGNTRIVDYRADDQTGFNAHVRRQGSSGGQLLSSSPILAAGSSVASLPTALPIAVAAQKPALLSIKPANLAVHHQSPQAILKPSYFSLPQQSAALQSLPLALHHQPGHLALAPQVTISQHAPIPLTQSALHLQQAAPVALAHQGLPIAALSHQGILAQHHLAAAPYAIAHNAAAPIAYQPLAYQPAAAYTSPQLAQLAAPAAFTIHK